ncbi:acylamino-acid-releasing enzyme-like [Entelurus aequoreus]|uniref:acylamino-acid-releasing enzyme-like n=1 Tax=Entelurus aequoreus TaxID=161455 RepID=UPI002B1D0A62|nr:acylamino-acid-releasing enzyme-like [Entelurus aequoreus]
MTRLLSCWRQLVPLRRSFSCSASCQVMTNPEDIAKLYRQLSLFPSLTRADVGPVITSQYGGKYSNIYTEWSQRDLQRSESVKFCKQYIVFHDDKSVVFSAPSGNCTEVQGVLLSQDAPSGQMKAVVRECTVSGDVKQFMEIWIKNIKVKSINITALKMHGKVYEDQHFGCLAWSHSETHLLYVAEKKRPGAESFFQTDTSPSSFIADEEEANGPQKGDQFVFYEDWGESLDGKCSPVICVLEVEGESVSVLEGVPKNISPGQAFWAPGDTGVVFVGWWHESFRLGLEYCPTRRSSLFYVALTDASCEQLSSATGTVATPRLSPDKRRIVYLKNVVDGPSTRWIQLCVYDWYTKKTSVVVDVVKRPREDGFTGIYSVQLSSKCWSADSQRIIVACLQRSRKNLLMVNTDTGSVTSLTSSLDSGAWYVLTVERDLIVASWSSPNCPPCLRVGFLPARNSPDKVVWVSMEEAQLLSEIDWQILTFTHPSEQDNSDYPGLDFEALLVKPKEVKDGVKMPLVVYPHGGPHLVTEAGWILPHAVLSMMGFALLLVNYRGSLGFGQDSILSLQGNYGTQEILDIQFAVESVLQGGEFDRQKMAIIGRSYGGFLACQLIGQHPDLYKACVAVNPVINLASMVGSTDIPDWCMYLAGYDYSTDSLLEPAVWEQMLNMSPIKLSQHVQTPVLLLVGENDKRVPPKQSIEYYRALKAKQVPVRLLMYTGNNHSLSSVDAESDGFMNTALWITKYLSHTE